MNKFLLLFSVAIWSVSCGTMTINKTSQFARSSSLAEMNGCYSNRTSYVHFYGGQEWGWLNYVSILGLFNIDDYADDVAIEFEDPNKIKLTYYTDSIRKDTVFYGKARNKFLEIIFHKEQTIIPLIYSSFSVDRIRVGLSSEGSGMTIETLSGSGGNLLFLAAGGAPTRNFTFARISDNGNLTPAINNEKWGYVDSMQNFIISPQYEYASRFELNVARVKVSGKWRLISSGGEVLTKCNYDWISPIDTLDAPHFIAWNAGKRGVLSLVGDEIIPVECDHLGTLLYGYSVFEVGDKKGIATREGILYPAIFSDANMSVLWMSQQHSRGVSALSGDINRSPRGLIAEVSLEGKRYMIDGQGYGYEFKNNSFFNTKIDWNNKVKIK